MDYGFAFDWLLGTPWKLKILNQKSWEVDGSDDFPDFIWVIFGFQPLLFRGVRVDLFDHVLSFTAYLMISNT